MLCIPTASVPGTLSDKLARISEAGFDGIELSVADVVGFDGSLEEIAKLVSSHGLQLLVLSGIEGPLTSERITTKVSMARRLGAPVLMLNIETVQVDQLPEVDSLKDVRLALMPTREVETDTFALVEQLDSPAIGLALNSGSALGDGSRPARLRDVPGHRVFHVQLTDGPGTPLLPGQGTLNLQGFIRVLVRAGFRGPWSVASTLQAKDAAENGFRALVNLLDEVEQTEPEIQFGIPRLPPRVPATGIEFIEFAVNADSADELGKMLSAMAFRRERRHVSKDVALWRQGAVNIVVNQDPKGYARTAFLNHGPTVCDMGLRVRDAAETVARATALGTNAFSQTVGLGELEIPAIRGVGGSVLHFIDENSDLHRVWDIEFDRVRRTAATQPAGIRRIDHIAQTMNYDEMQSWLLYYISTFEMEKSAIVNVSDPFGVVRSQAIESPEGEVRLNLNGAQGHQTFAGSFMADTLGAGVQHLAFLTDDIFETSAQLEHNGFARLHISPNYYVETQAQFSLDDALAKNMQAADILYDRDDAGEYFQIYSQPLFNGFFFEIVQRRGGYQGYGARNASVRLAAQARFRPTPGMPRA